MAAARAGFIAIALAVAAGVIGLVREGIRYRNGGDIDWGHVALAVGVPALIYAIVSGAASQGAANRRQDE